MLEGEAYRRIAGANLSPWSKRVVGRVKRVCRFEAEQMAPGKHVIGVLLADDHHKPILVDGKPVTALVTVTTN